jgi:hypothetical protein
MDLSVRFLMGKVEGSQLLDLPGAGGGVMRPCPRLGLSPASCPYSPNFG